MSAAGDGNMGCLLVLVVRKRRAPGVFTGDPLERKDRERPLVLSIVLAFIHTCLNVLLSQFYYIIGGRQSQQRAVLYVPGGAEGHMRYGHPQSVAG